MDILALIIRALLAEVVIMIDYCQYLDDLASVTRPGPSSNPKPSHICKNELTNNWYKLLLIKIWLIARDKGITNRGIVVCTLAKMARRDMPILGLMVKSSSDDNTEYIGSYLRKPAVISLVFKSSPQKDLEQFNGISTGFF